ncbi:MAG TPA: sigma-70 family RNA polymerase sigma factor [Thermoanaerobaculia bacterium]
MSEEARELLAANRVLIEKAVAFVCRRYRFNPDDAEEFVSLVNLKLVENDYAVLRAFQHRSSLASYLSSVVQHLALDYCNHLWGKWRASAEAERLGPVAVALERLLYRDGRSFDEAVAILGAEHGMSRAPLQALLDRLPERAPRHRDVGLEDAEPYARTGIESAEERVLADERRVAGEKLSALMAAEFERLPDDERLIFQLRFAQGMTVAQIARMLQRDQKLLYRLMEKRLREIRSRLERAGIVPREVLELIGREESPIAFDFGKAPPRPSIQSDEKVAAHSEDSP